MINILKQTLKFSCLNKFYFSSNGQAKPNCFFDINISGKPMGRIEFELFWDVTPKTCENFKSLCTGEKGTGKAGKLLSYKGSMFHRIIPGFMAQGGDFTRGDGRGGESIYGNKFEDENFKMLHDTKGLLSMANGGPNTNGSQFFITFIPCEWLDGKHVVFGKVMKGMNLLDVIELMGSQSGKTFREVTVQDCGTC
eukprot:TRINITY_DN2318_c0_g1_i1.p1 TRINITY_DN2318_c0_g1~~TRINITY_DN2318_c0_g1_i1.p1  ORF type:complete len:195 (-),score=33.46 TRINITY_DN2318_c0_g1_i1:518-1102(-)